MKNALIDITRPNSAGATENTVRLQANSPSIAGKITMKDCWIVALKAIVKKKGQRRSSRRTAVGRSIHIPGDHPTFEHVDIRKTGLTKDLSSGVSPGA